MHHSYSPPSLPSTFFSLPPQTAGTVSNYEGARSTEAFVDLASRLSLPYALPLPTPESLSSFLRSLPAPGVGFVLGRREGGREGEEEEEEERVFLAVARALRAVASFGVVGKEALEKGKGKELLM